MNPDAQVVLIVGIIAASAGLVGALGGAVVGWFLTGQSRQREEKRAAFAELLTAMDAFQMRLILLRRAVVAQDAPNIARLDGPTLDAVGRVDAARSVAALYLPTRLHNTLDDAVKACTRDYTSALKPEAMEIAVWPAWQAVLALAHRELGVKD